jgi:hypothetical protein
MVPNDFSYLPVFNFGKIGIARHIDQAWHDQQVDGLKNSAIDRLASSAELGSFGHFTPKPTRRGQQKNSEWNTRSPL